MMELNTPAISLVRRGDEKGDERDESARASKYGETVRIRMQHPRRVDVYSFARQFSKRSRSTGRSRNYIAK